MTYVAYKFRLYPNKEQEVLINKTFGCCRVVYNTILAKKIELYKTEGKTLSKFDCTKLVTQLKKEEGFSYLKEVDSSALNYEMENLDNSYKKFFKEKKGFPKFKSKYDNHKSYRTQSINNNIKVDFENNKIQLPKLKWVKCVLHREFNGKIKQATISRVPSGKYFVSILVDTEVFPMDKTNKKVGIDLGIKDLVITSDGKKFDNNKYIYKYEKKLAKLQRQLAKKKKGSNNYNKQRIKIARMHEKIANVRNYNLHQISKELVKENDVIVAETLKIQNMLKNHNLSKSINDCSWGTLTTQISYKCDFYDKKFIQIDTFFASSQTCSCCGYKNTDVKNLNVRKWECPECHTIHDRDINASINILNEGLKQLN